RMPHPNPASGASGHDPVLPGSRRVELQRAMTAGTGVVRTAGSLASTAATLAALSGEAQAASATPGPGGWETTNLLQLGQALTAVATLREETRGGHVRLDFPDRDDRRWNGHLRCRRSASGTLVTSYQTTPVQDLT
ncbi:MAG TPA: hypothetical protein VHM65_00655, partial [Candidatus Lustribacter sp.]|nr:hypothetical protein [Candidatus Lustribacter sp.]